MKDNFERYNWQVVVYDENDKVIASWFIKNRTEHEAAKEADADLTSEMVDWSMTKTN